MNNILLQIIAQKKTEIECSKQKIGLEELQKKCATICSPKRSLKQNLANSNAGIIAEFKRKSPSKGWINQKANLQNIVTGYEKSGAVAISVLTDNPFFGGSLADLQQARNCVNLPLLRKDFIIDEYQLYESKIAGADVVLLIAACLTQKKCEILSQKAHEIGLEILLEIHTEQEIEYINSKVDVIGVNNRNLDSFFTDIQVSVQLIKAIQKKCLSIKSFPIPISESGISNIENLYQLKALGFKGFLIGETFMKTSNPPETLLKIIQKI